MVPNAITDYGMITAFLPQGNQIIMPEFLMTENENIDKIITELKSFRICDDNRLKKCPNANWVDVIKCFFSECTVFREQPIVLNVYNKIQTTCHFDVINSLKKSAAVYKIHNNDLTGFRPDQHSLVIGCMRRKMMSITYDMDGYQNIISFIRGLPYKISGKVQKPWTGNLIIIVANQYQMINLYATSTKLCIYLEINNKNI